MKYKTNKGQELVIGGYKPGSIGFDYLLVGYYDGKDLIFIGKIKNGFTPPFVVRLLRASKASKRTFVPLRTFPEPKSARRGEALTAEVMKTIQWLQPKTRGAN